MLSQASGGHTNTRSWQFELLYLLLEKDERVLIESLAGSKDQSIAKNRFETAPSSWPTIEGLQLNLGKIGLFRLN
jgi:hypothetical protein